MLEITMWLDSHEHGIYKLRHVQTSWFMTLVQLQLHICRLKTAVCLPGHGVPQGVASVTLKQFLQQHIASWDCLYSPWSWKRFHAGSAVIEKKMSLRWPSPYRDGGEEKTHVAICGVFAISTNTGVSICYYLYLSLTRRLISVEERGWLDGVCVKVDAHRKQAFVAFVCVGDVN